MMSRASLLDVFTVILGKKYRIVRQRSRNTRGNGVVVKTAIENIGCLRVTKYFLFFNSKIVTRRQNNIYTVVRLPTTKRDLKKRCLFGGWKVYLIYFPHVVDAVARCLTSTSPSFSSVHYRSLYIARNRKVYVRTCCLGSLLHCGHVVFTECCMNYIQHVIVVFLPLLHVNVLHVLVLVHNILQGTE